MPSKFVSSELIGKRAHNQHADRYEYDYDLSGEFGRHERVNVLQLHIGSKYDNLCDLDGWNDKVAITPSLCRIVNLYHLHFDRGTGGQNFVYEDGIEHGCDSVYSVDIRQILLKNRGYISA